MKTPEVLDIENYYYDLPDEQIAKYPLQERDRSRLLTYCDGHINSRFFIELPEILTSQHHLVFNNTKVIQARLLFQKDTGAQIEILLLEPFSPSEYMTAFQTKEKTVWKCLVGNAKKWKTGNLKKQILFENYKIILKAELQGVENGCSLISFSWDCPAVCFSEILSHSGITPLPPYLKRKVINADKERYQTIYSKYEGSVAAPTAGLHFTESVFGGLLKKGIEISYITLHIGAGTFLPVKERNALKHGMHTEHFNITTEFIREILRKEKKIIAVGTTSVRTLESVYWIALKLISGQGIEKDLFFLDQWEHFKLKDELSRIDALRTILTYLERNNLEQLKASTRIMITPGYRFHMTDGIITNFHQPHSTLLLLIAAYTGDDWRKIYHYALSNNYRFLSYGDSSILL